MKTLDEKLLVKVLEILKNMGITKIKSFTPTQTLSVPSINTEKDLFYADDLFIIESEPNISYQPVIKLVNNIAELRFEVVQIFPEDITSYNTIATLENKDNNWIVISKINNKYYEREDILYYSERYNQDLADMERIFFGT